MKMRIVAFVMAMILVTVHSSPAGVIPERWEKVEALEPGRAVIVQIRGGERLNCAFSRLGTDEISFLEPNGNERRLPRSAILRIETAAVVRDHLRNGMLIGTLIGVAGGIASMVGFAHAVTDTVDWNSEEARPYLFGAALVGGGIGVATGALIDASIKHREVLYQAR